MNKDKTEKEFQKSCKAFGIKPTKLAKLIFISGAICGFEDATKIMKGLF